MSESSGAPAPTNNNSFYAVALVFLVLLAVISGFYLGRQNKNPAASSSPSPTVSSLPNPAVETSPLASISATPVASVSASPAASKFPASPEATTSSNLY